ncbi:hypothetical protein ASZ90_009873 [hydrocarbon metagenome]|uniref:Iron-sulfur cluster assembly scaffold protein iscu/nifu-like n=1 Tax=hydrocarbon metagenome TaxID=938273 RepID=A0A0W8FI31_9ZZZZ
MHCSVLAEEGIHAAIRDYRKQRGLELLNDDPAPDHHADGD